MTILCYHTFDAEKKTPYTVTHQRFEEEMRYLAVQKIPVIPLSALLNPADPTSPLPARAVVITIDDGYRTAKEIAWPILRRSGYPFTLFVYPHAISRLRFALSWEDLREMSKAGVDIESHSMTHPLLTHPSKAMIPAGYAAWLDEELAGSRKRLEAELHQPVRSIAYPYGGYDERVVERTRAAGYQVALTCDDGDVSGATDPYRLNRRLVFRQTSLKAFAGYFRSLPMVLTELSPRDGERIGDIPQEIVGRIKPAESVLPETAKILVDKLGNKWLPLPVDPKTGQFRLLLPPSATRRGYYFMSLVAQDRRDPTVQREASWLFIIKRNTSKK